MNMRDEFLKMNAEFLVLFTRLGLDPELVDCGHADNDGQGDHLPEAIAKVRRNLEKIRGVV